MVDSSGPCSRCVLFWISSNRKSSSCFTPEQVSSAIKAAGRSTSAPVADGYRCEQRSFLVFVLGPFSSGGKKSFVSWLSYHLCQLFCRLDTMRLFLWLCSESTFWFQHSLKSITCYDVARWCSITSCNIGLGLPTSVDLNFGWYLTLSRPNLAKYADTSVNWKGLT